MTLRGILSRWPRWSAWAAGVWSLGYGGLALYWTAGGGGFPFAPIDEDHQSGSVLEGSRAAIVAPIMAALAIAGVAVAVLMARGWGPGRRTALLAGFGWVLAGGLVLVIPDYTLLAVVAFAPLLVVFSFTGVPGPQGGIGDILYWHRTNLIVLFLGGLLWALATLAYQRRRRGACEHCGRRPGTDGGASPEALLRWGRRAVVVACVAPLPYEITRLSWFFGLPLGIPPSFLRMMQDTPGMLDVGLGCAVASMIGGVLTGGLVRRWGEVYPRWIWFKAGKRVPVALAVAPASIVAVAVIPAGLMMFWTMDARDGWALYLPSMLWLVWGAGLGGATIAYYLRRRGVCRHCGRGRVSPSPTAGTVARTGGA
jgi:hypothetical protein